MKIALFSPGIISPKFGATKNRIELAEALTKLGWQTSVMGNLDIGLPNRNVEKSTYREAFKTYLIKNAHLYDVVLYEYDTLPYNRTLFSKGTLFVARPALLSYHFDEIRIPLNLKSYISALIRQSAKKRRKNYNYIELTLSQSDLIQVQNTEDKKCLIKKGHPEDKIIIIPNGILPEKLELFKRTPKISGTKKIAFVGTFDFRKGALDFPILLKLLSRLGNPNAKIKLLGTKGLYSTQQQILGFFPKKLQHLIEIHPTFEPSELPALLSDCQVGVFPSYLESFGYGALEMMAAGLPVVGYDTPGPCDFLLPELKVPAGNTLLMAQKLNKLLNEPAYLEKMGIQAQKQVDKYNWDTIALEVSKTYEYRKSQLINGSLVK
ncbi:Glycosyltransferase involved in cell wall bisynthesis [Parapedobacter luteus]|uniref:Glycosyltransferase involved in cell wall bisynthesis n=1 Tax=Parapedobacter luteus TaxID=623280 RepID=A0A1T5FQI2_9SPHI|nr:glycosyltransferase family 4 protein [Parapedobacter luteus]SKB98360.1 Glycosyltransferase involved in cell wall bisynthesis [Parapedobacter luteus]